MEGFFGRKFTTRKSIPVPLFGAYFHDYNEGRKVSLGIRKVRALPLVVMTIESSLAFQLEALVGEQTGFPGEGKSRNVRWVVVGE